MGKKVEKNILANCTKTFYVTGLIFNLLSLIIATIIFLLIIFVDKTNIINEYENIINTSSMSENITMLFYSIICIINIIVVYILNFISLILGIVGYKFKNKILKLISVILYTFAIFLTLFLESIIGYFLILLVGGVSFSLFSLYLENELEKKKKNN